MEQPSKRVSILGQFHPEHFPNNRSGIWHLLNQSVHMAEEVICPEPRRINRAPLVVDSLNRFCCKPKSALPMHRRDCGLEILDIILSRDDSEGDLDSGNQMGFFCGSPPVRSSNPVIHDSQFAKQTITVASPLGNSHMGTPAAGVERGSPSCGSSLGGKPKVRIESLGNPVIHDAQFAKQTMGNPVIHDAQFAKQTMVVASPLGSFHAGKPAARVERGSPSCGGSSLGGKPKVRIEGFSSGTSESHCVVPALA